MFLKLLNKLPRGKSRDFSRLLTSFSAEQQNIVSEALQGQKVNIEGRLKGARANTGFQQEIKLGASCYLGQIGIKH